MGCLSGREFVLGFCRNEERRVRSGKGITKGDANNTITTASKNDLGLTKNWASLNKEG